MVWTENQATQFYVANSVSTTALTNDSDTGAVYVGTDKKGNKYLQVKGADTVLRSALINPKLLMSVKGTAAADMQIALKQATITLDSDVNGGEPISGQDYVMHIMVRQYQSISDEVNLVKTAAVHATASMSAADFYEALANSLELNFSRELTELFTFEASDSGVVITEVEQPWILGTFEQVPVYFEIYASTVTLDGDEVSWLSVEYADSSTVIGNGKKIADMEYFYAGEKGDQYRLVGWPNVIHTKYLVDPDTEYNTLNIHFAYVGANHSIQKSEKDIMIVSDSSTVINSIADSIVADTDITYESI